MKYLNNKNDKNYRGMFITDLDGTLLRTDRTFSEKDINSLKRLKDEGYVIVIATGRSYYSFKRVLVPELIFDYLIFSTGAGIIEASTGETIRTEHLRDNQIKTALNILTTADLDFMIHNPIPENHRFLYRSSGNINPDFYKRIKMYEDYCEPLETTVTFPFSKATQLLAILPKERDSSIIDELKKKLTDFNIIYTTSPLDEESQWIEIFPSSVSKSQSVEWLAEMLGIEKTETASIGNDFNDLDLLFWSEKSFVVENAPEYLRNNFINVSSNNSDGITEAVETWLNKRNN